MTRLSKHLFLLGSPMLLTLMLMVASGLAMVQAEAVAGQQVSPAVKTVYGLVVTEAGEAVSGALVTAQRIDSDGRAGATTAADGAYELALGPGLWAVKVELTIESTPGQWVPLFEAEQVAFEPNDQPERQALDFTVAVADAVVKGMVAMPDGSPPPFTVTIGLHDGEGFGRRVAADPETGQFRISLPQGRYDVVVHPHHDGYLGPQLEPVALRPGQVVDLGNIRLIALDAVITGKVSDENGDGVAGLPITTWQRDRFAAVSTKTGPGGVYRLAVSSGVWHVQPSPGPDSGYLYLGEGQTVKVGPGELARNVDFKVLTADATIVGLLAAPADMHMVSLEGWATAVNTANPRIRNGGPIRAGRFAIHVPGGGYLVSAYLPPGSPYFSATDIPAKVKPGETVTITIPLEKKDAAIAGPLVDPRQNVNPVTDVGGVVTAWSDDRWAATPIRPETGTYKLAVAGGLWHLNYRLRSQEYVKIGQSANIPVESGETVRWPLLVTRKDAAISGRVFSPAGGPLAGALVIADGLSGDVSELRLRTRTDRDGRFQLSLPYGRYHVGAVNGEPGWISPVDWLVNVAPGTVVENIKLHFRKPNAEISGQLTVPDTIAEGNALVWAWSERGGFTSGRFPLRQTQTDPGGQASGPYRLGVLTGQVWHVGAVFETEEAYWFARQAVRVTGNGVNLDLALKGPFPKPPPVVVTFDAEQAQRLTLADGSGIFIPAGAMPVEGEVTLRIVPVASLPHQEHASVIRYGYAFFATDASGRPIEEQFDLDVLIRFRYDGPDAASLARRIRPAYFSTTTNEWTIPDRYVVNLQRRTVTMAIDHFTNFALVEEPMRPAQFLPVVTNGCLAGRDAAVGSEACLPTEKDSEGP